MTRRERLRKLIEQLPDERLQIVECYLVARFPQEATAAGVATEGPPMSHEEARALIKARFGVDVGPAA